MMKLLFSLLVFALVSSAGAKPKMNRPPLAKGDKEFVMKAGETKKIKGTKWSIQLISETLSDSAGETNTTYETVSLKLSGPQSDPQNGKTEKLYDTLSDENMSFELDQYMIGASDIVYKKGELKSARIRLTKQPAKKREIFLE